MGGKKDSSAYVLTQMGPLVMAVKIDGMSRKQRERARRHQDIVVAYLNLPEGDMAPAQFQREKIRLEHQLAKYRGKMSGGKKPVEYASNPAAIRRMFAG
jgi:hypothetical protein